MVVQRMVERPAFRVLGWKTYISGPDNEQFGRFWDVCRAAGRLELLTALTGAQPGPQTGGVLLGVSRVEADPARREFDYMVAAEVAGDGPENLRLGPEDLGLGPEDLGLGPEDLGLGPEDLGLDGEVWKGAEVFTVPASRWAVFDAHGPVPDAIVEAEMFAFMTWLPASGLTHAFAPEMEVYLPGENRCEFWLPVR